jgi:acyl carrier protein
MDKNEIYAILVSNLVKIFDIPQEKITLESRLYEDLDIDSIDAIDLIVRLKKYISKPMTPFIS